MDIFTTPLGNRWPAEWADPFIDEISLTYTDMDTIQEDADLAMLGGGALSLVGDTFTWSAPFYVYSSRAGTFVTIPANSVTLVDGNSIYFVPTARPLVTETKTLQAGNVPHGAIWCGTRSGSSVVLRSLGAHNDDTLWTQAGAVLQPKNANNTLAISSNDASNPVIALTSTTTSPGALSITVPGSGYGVLIDATGGSATGLQVKKAGSELFTVNDGGNANIKGVVPDSSEFGVYGDAVSPDSFKLLGGSSGQLSLDAEISDAVIVSGGNWSVTANGSEIYLGATGGELKVVDSFHAGAAPAWTQGYLTLSDASSEWDLYKSNFGEVSLLAAVNAAYATSGGIPTYSQTTEPTLPSDGDLGVWIDTDASNQTWLVYRRGTGDQVKVEMT